MKLELDPLDLKSEYQAGNGSDSNQPISTCNVTFNKLNEEVQTVTRVVVRATFYSFDHQTYNAIRPPKC